MYRIRDLERGADIAIKLLRSVDASTLYRFKKEFRPLAEMNHSNLVTLYELIELGERWFLAMELIEGRDFLAYVRGVDAVPMNTWRMPLPSMTWVALAGIWVSRGVSTAPASRIPRHATIHSG